MQAVTITQISPNELESLIERTIFNFFNAQKKIAPVDTDRWFDLVGLCSYLPDKPTKATVYGWVAAGTIPYHKGGKKLRFLKSEIDNWLKSGWISPLLEESKAGAPC